MPRNGWEEPYLATKETGRTAAWLKVYDINSNVVLRQQIKQSVEQIDVSKMPAGTYVYEVLSNIGQQLFNGKIIVLH